MSLEVYSKCLCFYFIYFFSEVKKSDMECTNNVTDSIGEVVSSNASHNQAESNKCTL